MLRRDHTILRLGNRPLRGAEKFKRQQWDVYYFKIFHAYRHVYHFVCNSAFHGQYFLAKEHVGHVFFHQKRGISGKLQWPLTCCLCASVSSRNVVQLSCIKHPRAGQGMYCKTPFSDRRNNQFLFWHYNLWEQNWVKINKLKLYAMSSCFFQN